MMNIYLAVAYIWTKSTVVVVTAPALTNLASGRVAGLPMPFLLLALGCLLGYLLLQRTYFGRTLQAIGSSEVAAAVAGLPVVRAKIIAFVTAGLLAGVAAIALTGLLSSASGNMASATNSTPSQSPS